MAIFRLTWKGLEWYFYNMDIPLNPLASTLPGRLSPRTTSLARQYLTGQFRKDLLVAPFSSADLGDVEGLPQILIHGRMAELIAGRAPLGFRPYEKIIGAAPFKNAIWHMVPGMDRGSISHTTADFGDAVSKGLRGIEADLVLSAAEAADPEKRLFAEALGHVVHAMRIWRDRQIEACDDFLSARPEDPDADNVRAIRATLAVVPENPPSSFREALQSFWSFFEFQRLCGNWSGLGRFDQILGPYLEKDLAAGVLTLDEARELVAHFWIKGTEWCWGMRQLNPDEPGSGDAQHYQNVILGGVGPDGTNVENAVTYLVLDVIEELHISDYPVAVRVNSRTSQNLLRRIAEVQMLGGGIVSIYGEEVVLEGLRRFGYPPEEAAAFTNDGCWEVIIPGQTRFGYTPFDILHVFQQALLEEDAPADLESLYAACLRRLGERLAEIRETIILPRFYQEAVDPGTGAKTLVPDDPCTDAVLSLVMPSCRASRRSYTSFGTKYTVCAIHAGGLPDVANSLLAIKRYVFEEKRLSLPDLIGLLKRDWDGAEQLRGEIRKGLVCYGNDDDEADAMLRRVFDDYAAAVGRVDPVPGVLIPTGVSTFGREIAFAPQRAATAFGCHAHAYLAPNLSPTPGTERNALTAVINSYCKMDFTKTPNGCPLDLRLSAGFRRAPGAADLLASVLRVFHDQGGFYLQLDAIDADTLRAAQKDPDRYPNLVVRISGWSARFASLSREWQEMVINRATLSVS